MVSSSGFHVSLYPTIEETGIAGNTQNGHPKMQINSQGVARVPSYANFVMLKSASCNLLLLGLRRNLKGKMTPELNAIIEMFRNQAITARVFASEEEASLLYSKNLEIILGQEMTCFFLQSRASTLEYSSYGKMIFHILLSIIIRLFFMRMRSSHQRKTLVIQNSSKEF